MSAFCGGRGAGQSRRLLLALAVAVVALLTLGGCSSSGAPGAASSAESAPRPGGTYRFPLESDLTGITPLDAEDAGGRQVAHQLFEGLVRYETQEDGTLATVPCLAESWDTNQNATVFRFRLRRRARFAPPVSRLVTAHDVVRSWERATDPTSPAPNVDVLAPVLGLDDSGRQVDPDLGLLGVKAVGASVIRVELRYPCADFPERLGVLAAAVMPVSYIDRVGWKEFRRRPVGTGQFLVERWDRRGARLVRNPDYWEKDRAAYVQRVHLNVVGGASRQWRQFRAGRIDYTAVPTGRERIVSSNPRVLAGEWSAQLFPTLSVSFVGINMHDGTLGRGMADALELRSALAYSADRTGVVEIGGRGTPLAAQGIVPPSVPGYRKGQSPYGYDPDKARQALTLAGTPSLSIDLWTTSDAHSRGVAEILRAGWLSLGIQTIERITAGPASLEAGTQTNGLAGQQTFLGTWTADYPSMDAFLAPLFLSGGQDLPLPTSAPLTYQDAELDRLIAEARATVDDGAREALYAQVEQRILRAAAAIPLAYPRVFRVTRARVHGQQLDPLGFVDMSLVWIEQP